MSEADLKVVIRSLLNANGQPMKLYELEKVYRETEGESIPYSRYGYPNIFAMLKAFPDVVRFEGNGKYTELHSVVTERSKHIKELVQKTQTKKRNRINGQGNRNRQYNNGNNENRGGNLQNQGYNSGYGSNNQTNQNQSLMGTYGGGAYQLDPVFQFSANANSSLLRGQLPQQLYQDQLMRAHYQNQQQLYQNALLQTLQRQQEQQRMDSLLAQAQAQRPQINFQRKTHQRRTIPAPPMPLQVPKLDPNKGINLFLPTAEKIPIPKTPPTSSKEVISKTSPQEDDEYHEWNPQFYNPTKINNAVSVPPPKKDLLDVDETYGGDTSSAFSSGSNNRTSSSNANNDKRSLVQIMQKLKVNENKSRGSKIHIFEEIKKPIEEFPQSPKFCPYVKFKQEPLGRSDEGLAKKIYSNYTDFISEVANEDGFSIFSQCDFVPIKVVELYSPYKFWFILRQNEAKLRDLQKQMNAFYKEVDIDDHKIIPKNKKCCVVRHEEVWYRAEIAQDNQDDNGMLTVFLIDFGSVLKVNMRYIKGLLKQFSELPKQAMRGRLASVKPIGIKWYLKSVQLFKKLVDRKTLFALSELQRVTENIHFLTLVDTNGDDDVNIAKTMIEQGLAESDDIEGDDSLALKYPNFEMIERGVIAAIVE